MSLYHSDQKTKTIMAQETRQQQFSAGNGPAVAQQPPTQQPSAAPQSAQSVQPTPRPCPQDCLRCSVSQQVYCSTKMLFDLSRSYQEARQQIASVEAAIAGIQAQLQSTGTDGQLSTPIIETT